MKRKKQPLSLLQRAERMRRSLPRRGWISEVERCLVAIALAGTPEERWDLNQVILSRIPAVARQAMLRESFEAAEAHARSSGMTGREFALPKAITRKARRRPVAR